MPIVRNACIALVLLSTLLDILIYKYRKLVHILILLELVFNLLVKMVPSQANDYSIGYMWQGHFIVFVAYYSNQGWQIVASSVSLLVMT